ncbi:hypothetical protein B0T21DRAFT_440817 [Apiosordaria backusii]|uniref:Uncharacterized protein n=1 Tax=Apiosordaria backusii TaxID=314023 RepID=A0AA40BLI5_9PEZI|nr:hypothetical protein B0T21DRAFT_440817 [Apiosordaria backusii]
MAPLQQNTFVVVPNPVSFQQALAMDGPESKPPMTSKQAQKAYRQANKLPKLTKAEQLRQERAEQERIRKEEEKLKASKRAKVLRDRKKAKELELREEKRRQGLPLVTVRPSQATLSTFFNGNGASRKRDSGAFEADQAAMTEELEDKENQTPVGSPSESSLVKRQRLEENLSQQEYLQREETPADLLQPTSPEELLEAFIDDFPTASQAARELEDDEALVETTEPSPARRGPPASKKTSPSQRSVLKQAIANSQRNLATQAAQQPILDDDIDLFAPFSSRDLAFSSQDLWELEDEMISPNEVVEQADVNDTIDGSSPCVPTLRFPSPSQVTADKISSEPVGEPSAGLGEAEDTLDGFTYSQFYSSSFKPSDEEVEQPQPLTNTQPPCKDGAPDIPERSRSPQRFFGSSGNGIAILQAVAQRLDAEKEAEKRRLEQVALERWQRYQAYLEREREEERLAEQAAAAAELVASQHDDTQQEGSMAPLSQESDYGADLTLDNVEMLDSMVVPMEAGSEDSDEYGPGLTLDNVELLEANLALHNA